MPLRGSFEPADHPEDGCFGAPTWPEKSDELAGTDAEAYVFDCREASDFFVTERSSTSCGGVWIHSHPTRAGQSEPLRDLCSGPGHLPSSSGHLPSGSADLPSVFRYLPSGSGYLPSGSEHLPSGSEHLPSGSEHLPSGSEHLPSGSEHLPSGSEYLPSGFRYLPSSRPVTFSQRTDENRRGGNSRKCRDSR
jgi:hypothetical protein